MSEIQWLISTGCNEDPPWHVVSNMAGYIDRTNIFHYEIARLGGTTPSILNKEYNKNHIDEQSNNVKNELNSLDLKLDRLAECKLKII